jgi:hypothetical protein
MFKNFREVIGVRDCIPSLEIVMLKVSADLLKAVEKSTNSLAQIFSLTLRGTEA